MLRVIRSLLLKIVDDIDAGNSNITEGEALEIVDSLKRFTDKEKRLHEAEHIKNHIWQYIGYTPQRDNDEVDAYLLTYIYDKITQVFYKHKDNKE